MLMINEFREKYNIKVCTDHTGKMTGLCSISTSCMCNENCAKRRNIKDSICSRCFSATMQKRMNTLQAVLIENYNALTTTLIPVEDMPMLYSPSGLFRLEAFGDIATTIQVVNYFNFCIYNPHLKFALWTKNPWIIEQAMKEYNLEKPSNLRIIGSSYMINEPMEKFFKKYDFIDNLFTVYRKKYAAENNIDITCGARSCAKCRKCYDGTHETFEIRELLK
jgi:hypothetical protein